MNNPEPDPRILIDQCCDAFESRFGSEKSVTIEQLLSKVSDSQRAAYLKPLLQIELELRTKAGETPSVDELLQRFPKHADVVQDVVQNPEIRDSLAHQETIAPQNGSDDDSVPTSSGMRIPKQLGRYRITRKLGQGAMGSVLLAHDEQLDRQVALKIPREDLQHNTEVRLRFEREAQAAAALHHPNICPIYDIGEFEGIHYICMGYVEGFPLSRYAIAESGLTEQRIAELVLKMAKALAVAHEAGFIHRDLKPANVMIDLQEEPVILDFGLARRIDRDEDIRVTQTGTTIGSPAYMSPEQVEADQDKVGPHSDIYSLGVILYELLTGRIPFEGSMASVMGQIMTKEPDKPSDYRKDLTVRLEKLCLKMMAKDAGQRQPSMHAVVSELQEYLDRHTRIAQASSEDASPTPTADRVEQRKTQIEQLISSGDYAQAEKLMVALSRETDESLLTAASWAAAELPKLRKTREEVRAGRQEMYSTAARLMKSHDYQQAMRLLEEYPYDLRTPKMQDLLERAEGKVNEVERLRKEIKTARKRGDNVALLALVKQLLELKPADRRAKELHEQLTKRAAGPISQVMGKNSPTFVSNMSSGLQWVAVAGVFLLLCCYPAYQWSKDYLNGPPLEVADNGGDPIIPPEPTDGEEPAKMPPPIPAPPTGPEWTDLFNGKDLTGWTSQGSDAKWAIDKNVLKGESGDGWLVSDASYGNFELELEYQLSQSTQSGVGIRLPSDTPIEGGKYLEVQLLHNQAKEFSKVSAKNKHGSLWGIAAASEQNVSIDQWHLLRIRAVGRQISVFDNDLQILDTDLSSYSELSARQPGALGQNGRVALQLSKTPVVFRNIRICAIAENEEIRNAALESRLYVNCQAGENGDGRSWASAVRDLQAALFMARSENNPVKEIWIASGTYLPSGNGDKDLSFQLVDGVALHGGFRGNESALNDRDRSGSETILSGDLKNNDGPNFTKREDNSFRVVRGSGLEKTVTIDSITVSGGGEFQTKAKGRKGGGIRIQGKAIIRNVKIIGCAAYTGGGMLIDPESNVEIRQSQFLKNEGKLGGGLCVRSRTELYDCVFQSNSASDDGAALALGSVDPGNAGGSLVRNCRFISNSAVAEGGAIRICEHRETDVESARRYDIVECLFKGNRSTAMNNGGALAGGLGARLLRGASLNLLNCRFEENKSTSGNSGAALAFSGNAEVNGCTFTNNRCPSGATIQVLQWGHLSLGYSTIAANQCSAQLSLLENAKVDLRDSVLHATRNSPAFEKHKKAQVNVTNSCVTRGNRDVKGSLGNPTFTEVAKKDFSLSRQSPGHGRGDKSRLPTDTFDLDNDGNSSEPVPVDVYGNPRITGGKPNVGAIQ